MLSSGMQRSKWGASVREGLGEVQDVGRVLGAGTWKGHLQSLGQGALPDMSLHRLSAPLPR